MRLRVRIPHGIRTILDQNLFAICVGTLFEDEELAEAMLAPEEIAAKRDELVEAIAEAEERRVKAADALAEAEGSLREAAMAEREAERLAGEARETRARAEARLDAARALGEELPPLTQARV